MQSVDGFAKSPARDSAPVGPADPETEARASLSSQQLAAIEGNVRLVQTMFSELAGHDLPPGREGVAFLDGFIERQRTTQDEDTKKKLIDILACYLGASFIAVYGGRWIRHGGLAVEITPKLVVFPFAKTEKHFSEGAVDPVLSMFDTMRALRNYYP